MNTLITKSPDGVRIAYDRTGTGSAIILLHGGGSNRQVWHEAGYVSRLRADHTVITLDLRGHGESDLPIDPAAFSPEKMGEDILAVADACGIERFIIWGMSYGGKVGRYLAARSERVAKIIFMGIPFGPAVHAEMRLEIQNFCEHWPPILQARREKVLDIDSLSQEDRDFMSSFDVPVIMAWGRAMLDWPSIEPADIRCPSLWLVGSEDRVPMASVKEYEGSLKDNSVQLHVVEGLDHQGVFLEIDEVFSTILAFIQS